MPPGNRVWCSPSAPFGNQLEGREIMECKIQMKDKRVPVEGTVSGAEGKRTGTCPECLTPGVVLSIVGGFIRKHTIASVELPENNPQPATLTSKPAKKIGTGLSEPVTDLTDTGARMGDPRAAEQRRVDDIGGANGTGTVKIPVTTPPEGGKKGKGRTKLEEVPATEENVRTALDYWKNRKVRSDASRKAQSEHVSSLVRRLDGFRKVREAEAAEKLHPLSARDSDVAAVHRGPTLVRGRDETPRLRDPELPWSEGTDLRRDGTVRMSTTFELPLGRERFDRKITDVPEPKRKRTAAERRRYRRAQLNAATTS